MFLRKIERDIEYATFKRLTPATLFNIYALFDQPDLNTFFFGCKIVITKKYNSSRDNVNDATVTL